MTTDPLCPQQHTHPKHDPNRCIFCEYGGAVREDERGKVNPPTPFPMGAKVRGVGGTRVLTVTGWGFYPALGKWFVRVETGDLDEEGEREYALMYLWELELVTYEQGQRDEREACIALVETVAQSGAYIDYVEIDSVIAAIRARSDGGES